MKYLFVAMAIGAAALSASTAQAGGEKAKPNVRVSQSTDISAQHRHGHHGHRQHHWRPHHHGYYRPHYGHGYYPRHHGYYGGGPYGYYGGGPGVTFSFGGSRW